MRNSKLLLIGLLLIACLLSSILVLTVPISSTNSFTELANLHNIIDIAIDQAGLPVTEFYKSTLKIDSTFSRSVYLIQVPSSFSKTSFHHALNHQLQIYNIECLAKVFFPEKNMHIHLMYNGTIFRTIRLITDQIPKNSAING